MANECGRHTSELRITLNACVLAVASCYANHALALPRATGSPPQHLAMPVLDALAAIAASIPASQRWALPPAPDAAPPPQASVPDRLLDERTTPLRTLDGGRLQTVGPQSLEPVLKVTPAGDVLLDAGASVRYSDTHRPGIRIELTAPGGADVTVGRKDSAGAVINPYAALVRSPAKPVATMVVVENGRVFLRRAEAPVIAQTTVPPLAPFHDVVLKPSSGLPVARLQTMTGRNDVRPLDAAPDVAADAALGLKMESQIVDPFFSGENWVAVTEHAVTEHTVPVIAAAELAAPPEPAAPQANDGVPGNDTPLASRQPDALLAPERRELFPHVESGHSLAEGADLTEVSEAGLPYEADAATLAGDTPDSAAQDVLLGAVHDAPFDALQDAAPTWQAVQVYAPDTLVSDAAERAALVILPEAIRAPDPGTAANQSAQAKPRAPMTRIVIDLFDDPAEVETDPADFQAVAATQASTAPLAPRRAVRHPPKGVAHPDARVIKTHGSVSMRARTAAILRKSFLIAHTRKD